MYRYINKYGRGLVYGGVPERVMTEIKERAENKGYVVHYEDSIWQIKGFTDERMAYEGWFRQQENKNEIRSDIPNKSKENYMSFAELLKEIKEYPLANKSPIDAIQFIAYLQEKLKQYGTLL